MARLYSLALLLLLASPSAFARLGCDPERIMYVHESGFGLTIGSGRTKAQASDSRFVNLPVTIDGARGCFRQKSSLKLESERENNAMKGTILIHPIQADFENVPSGRIKTYVMGGQDTSHTFKLSVLSVACGGSSVMAVESFEGGFEAIERLKQAQISVSSVFAVGLPAQRVQEGSEIPAAFRSAYSPSSPESTGPTVIAPSVYAGSTLQANSVGVATHFQAGNELSKSQLCTPEFESKMKDSLIENLGNNPTLTGLKTGKTWRGIYKFIFSLDDPNRADD